MLMILIDIFYHENVIKKDFSCFDIDEYKTNHKRAKITNRNNISIFIPRIR